MVGKSTGRPQKNAQAPKGKAVKTTSGRTPSTRKTVERSSNTGIESHPSAAQRSAAKKKDGISSTATPAPKIVLGKAAPAFGLPDENGKFVSLKDFRGSVLVLFFYPKDNTPGCTQESCDFRDHMNRLSSVGAAVVGVSADSVESHKKFKTKYELNFPLLSDPHHEALSAYGVWQEKSLYGRKFMGIVRSTFVIDAKGILRAVFPKVSVKGHAEEVLAILKKMKADAKAGNA